jgi:DNA-binding transcriptional regulator YdaS (Cro superfamily)
MTKKKGSAALARIRQQRGAAMNLARRLKLYPSSITRWKRVPAHFVLKVEKITGIPRSELRPDLYPQG